MTDTKELIARLRALKDFAIYGEAADALESLTQQLADSESVAAGFASENLRLQAEVERLKQVIQGQLDLWVADGDKIARLEAQLAAAQNDLAAYKNSFSALSAQTSQHEYVIELPDEYVIELPDGDVRETKVWWVERKLTGEGVCHRLSISVSETPSALVQQAQPDPAHALQAEVERLKAALNQQVALVEKCMVAMNENADRGQAAEDERDALQAQQGGQQ
jgi:hypothetical protein